MIPSLTIRAIFAATTLVAIADRSVHAPTRPKGTSVAQPSASFKHGGIVRSYVVRAPRGIRPTDAPVPMVLVLHGGGGNAANAEKMTGFTDLVERERIIVVYPDGTARRPRIPLRTWNAGHCCGSAMEDKVDDVGFINALIDSVSARYPVDPQRTYATGMSNGAMMSHRLGRELSHRLAAIAPVVGTVFGDEAPTTRPVSAIIINGLLDKAVPPQGGPSGGRGADAWNAPARPNEEQATYWARANGCDATPSKETRGADIVTRYTCPPGRRVELHQLKDNGHAWPGGQAGSRRGDKPSTSMDATEVIWSFFASVRKAP